jgi:serralysin
MPVRVKGRQAAAAAAGIASADATGDPRIDGLVQGPHWTGTVRYGDPADAYLYGPAYPEPLSGFERIGASQLATAEAALSTVARFTGLDLAYAGPGAGEAEIRLANTSDNPTAASYFPSLRPQGGDVFFGASGRDPSPGNYHAFTVLHELGHALGLKHGHDDGPFGSLPGASDSIEFSVMTYRSFVGADARQLYNEFQGYPTTWMILDIAALQHLYGADYQAAAGDTVYAWQPGTDRIFETIWDGAGVDTYDLSAYASDLRLDLAPGGHSTFDAAQLARLGGGPNGGFARGNVFNALLHDGDPRSLIENARGGSGDDAILGNFGRNALTGGGGNDRLSGGAGADVLSGGAGIDVLRGGERSDRLAGGIGADRLVGGGGGDVFVFAAPRDSRPGAADVLHPGAGVAAFQLPGRRPGDLIDLSLFDAAAGVAGDQPFVLGRGHGPGHLWALDLGTDTHIRGNTGGSRAPEFELVIEDGRTLADAYTIDDFLGVV